jgi:hypothetical protein
MANVKSNYDINSLEESINSLFINEQNMFGGKVKTTGRKKGSKSSKKGSKGSNGSKRPMGRVRRGSKEQPNNKLKKNSKKGSKKNSKKGSKKTSRVNSRVNSPINALSDSIDVLEVSRFQNGGKKKKTSSKGSKPKRTLNEKLIEYQKLVKHIGAKLGGGPVAISLAKVIRDEVMNINKNIQDTEITQKAKDLFDKNISKWTNEYNKIKANLAAKREAKKKKGLNM